MPAVHQHRVKHGLVRCCEERCDPKWANENCEGSHEDARQNTLTNSASTAGRFVIFGAVGADGSPIRI